jgi:acyl dehydratase
MAGIAYWEDLVGAPPRRFGPLSFPAGLLHQLLDLMGEKHPIHDDPAFAALARRDQPVVPGGFIHSITSGWTVRHGAPAAIIGLRSMSWDFVRPLYPGVPFYFTTETTHTEEIDERTGLVGTVRRVTDEAGRAYAIGRLSAVMLRRSAALSMEASAS